jgi:hypothetical protein
MVVSDSLAQGLYPGCELVRVGDTRIAGLDQDDLAPLISQRPMTAYFLLPVGAAQKGDPTPFAFDASPTGLKLNWNETERAFLVHSVAPGSQAARLVSAAATTLPPATCLRPALTVSSRSLCVRVCLFMQR